MSVLSPENDALERETMIRWKVGWQRTDRSFEMSSGLWAESVLLPLVVPREKSRWSEIEGVDERRESGCGGLT